MGIMIEHPQRLQGTMANGAMSGEMKFFTPQPAQATMRSDLLVSWTSALTMAE